MSWLKSRTVIAAVFTILAARSFIIAIPWYPYSEYDLDALAYAAVYTIAAITVWERPDGAVG